MTDQKPNCSTCDKPDCLFSKESYGLACLDHPGAREWLMRDVIKELERISNQSVGSQYKYALGDAIALIKDGVNHD